MRPAGFPAKFGCYRSSNATDRSVSNGSNAFLVTAPAPLGARRRALAVAIALFVVFCALIPFAHVPLPRIEAFDPIFESMLALAAHLGSLPVWVLATVVASGGMCDGGRILHYLKRHLDDPRCTIVLISYQAPGTVGRQLTEPRPTVQRFLACAPQLIRKEANISPHKKTDVHRECRHT